MTRFSFYSIRRGSARYFSYWNAGVTGESIGNPSVGRWVRTSVIAEKAAKCIYIPSLGQSLYFARSCIRDARDASSSYSTEFRMSSSRSPPAASRRQEPDNGYQVKSTTHTMCVYVCIHDFKYCKNTRRENS